MCVEGVEIGSPEGLWVAWEGPISQRVWHDQARESGLYTKATGTLIRCVLRHSGSRWGGTGVASLNGPPKEVTPLAKFPGLVLQACGRALHRWRAWVGAAANVGGEHGVTRLRGGTSSGKRVSSPSSQGQGGVFPVRHGAQ